ncbi:uncharacterized protein HaLaN_03480 [Haematococcus lacustris]|uniref:Uncharacterized protein n=1 Tax=Haematococcus lacustris TaxID=44745 RepID=A0A699YNM1_HAELA|nr:uncharacterized protein HaLaN_03480 [Haematococcus lacustris]
MTPQPEQAALHLPSASAQALALLHLSASRLRHLQLLAPNLDSCLWLLGQSGGQAAGQYQQGDQLWPLTALGQQQGSGGGLRALDLSGCSALEDTALVGPLLALTELQVLDLSHTAVGDSLLQALSFRLRTEVWAAAQQQPLPPTALAWPRAGT